MNGKVRCEVVKEFGNYRPGFIMWPGAELRNKWLRLGWIKEAPEQEETAVRSDVRVETATRRRRRVIA